MPKKEPYPSRAPKWKGGRACVPLSGSKIPFCHFEGLQANQPLRRRLSRAFRLAPCVLWTITWMYVVVMERSCVVARGIDTNAGR
jgi:hypothetical protein